MDFPLMFVICLYVSEAICAATTEAVSVLLLHDL